MVTVIRIPAIIMGLISIGLIVSGIWRNDGSTILLGIILELIAVVVLRFVPAVEEREVA